MSDAQSHDKEDAIAFKKQEKHGVTLSLLAGFIIVLVIISVLVYRSGIDPKKLKADIAGFQDYLNNVYADKGVDITFDYSGVDIKGGLFRKTVVLSEPELSIAKDGIAYSLSSATANVIPNDEHYRSFSIEFSDAVVITQADTGRVISFDSDEVIAIALTSQKQAEGNYSYFLDMPNMSDISITEGGKTVDYTLQTASNSTLTGVFTLGDPSAYEFSLSWNAPVMSHEAQQAKASIIDYSYAALDGQQFGELHMEAFTSTMLPEALLPIAVDVNQRVTLDEQDGSRAYTIDQFLVQGNQFRLDVEGGLTLQQGELLPLVEMLVMLEGAHNVVDALSEAHNVAPGIKSIIKSSLKRIAPNWHESTASPLEFSVIRTPEQPFRIGAIKADELFAWMIREYIHMQTIPSTSTEAEREEAAEPMLNGVMPEDDEKAAESSAEDASGAVSDGVEEAATSEPDTIEAEPASEDAKPTEQTDGESKSDQAKEESVPSSQEGGLSDAVSNITPKDVLDQVKEEVEPIQTEVDQLLEDQQSAINNDASEETVPAEASSEAQ